MAKLKTRLKTCEICGWTWDPHPWTKCPRCVSRTTAYEPTHAEIRAACAEIQATWSPAERARRAQLRATPADTPVCEVVWTRG